LYNSKYSQKNFKQTNPKTTKQKKIKKQTTLNKKYNKIIKQNINFK